MGFTSIEDLLNGEFYEDFPLVNTELEAMVKYTIDHFTYQINVGDFLNWKKWSNVNFENEGSFSKKSKIKVLQFWSTDCQPCLNKLEDLKGRYNELETREYRNYPHLHSRKYSVLEKGFG